MRQKHLGADGHLKSLCKLAGAKLGQRKRSIRSIIYQIIPLRCTRYLEPFGGSFCVLIGKPKAPFEAINDLNPWPVNFFRCLQKDPVRLYRMIRKLLDGFDKERFLKLRRFLVTDNGFVQYKEGFPAAAAFYCVTKMAMNGVIRMNLRGENNSTYCGTTKGRGLLTADWTRRVLHRMKDVRICKMDYWAFLKAFNYSTPRTFTYCDPPPPTTRRLRIIFLVVGTRKIIKS